MSVMEHAQRQDADIVENQPEPLHVCVERALTRYFVDLDGHAPGHLYDMVMREVEYPLLKRVLAYTAGNHTKAAQILGINRATLRKKLQAHGLE